MDRYSAISPEWLSNRIRDKGGSISFHQFMDWCLNDPVFGAYSAGKLKIGIDGDFVTSPSLGSDFAELLSIQIIDWFNQLIENSVDNQLINLIDIGPGEGHLARDLVRCISKEAPHLINKLQLVLIEPNEGMRRIQSVNLKNIDLKRISWKTYKEASFMPGIGVVIAHEILDALPVERVIYKKNKLYRQGIELIKKNNNYMIKFSELDLSDKLKKSIFEMKNFIQINIPPSGIKDGWNSEIQCDYGNWFEKTSRIIKKGMMLIVDYSLDADKFYNSVRSEGTILAYKNNISYKNVLNNPGDCDITAHLCFDHMKYFAHKYGWEFQGKTSQGEALLALGLAEKLHSLQKFEAKDLSIALNKRETLLRLVDPSNLGGFKWIAFGINNSNICTSDKQINTIFLNEPSA